MYNFDIVKGLKCWCLVAEKLSLKFNVIITRHSLLDTYKAASTPEEMEKMKEALSAETDWLEEDSWGETYVVKNVDN